MICKNTEPDLASKSRFNDIIANQCVCMLFYTNVCISDTWWYVRVSSTNSLHKVNDWIFHFSTIRFFFQPVYFDRWYGAKSENFGSFHINLIPCVIIWIKIDLFGRRLRFQIAEFPTVSILIDHVCLSASKNQLKIKCCIIV